jgi:hypothetical protein
MTGGLRGTVWVIIDLIRWRDHGAPFAGTWHYQPTGKSWQCLLSTRS